MPKTKTEVKTVEPIVCPICGETFKSKSGLSGHMQLSHSELKVKTYPDEIGERLEAIEHTLIQLNNIVDILRISREVNERLKSVNKILEELTQRLKKYKY